MFLSLRNSLEICRYLTVAKLVRIPSIPWVVFLLLKSYWNLKLANPVDNTYHVSFKRQRSLWNTLLWINRWLQSQLRMTWIHQTDNAGYTGDSFHSVLSSSSSVVFPSFTSQHTYRLAWGRGVAQTSGGFFFQPKYLRVQVHTRKRDLCKLGAVQMGVTASVRL